MKSNDWFRQTNVHQFPNRLLITHNKRLTTLFMTRKYHHALLPKFRSLSKSSKGDHLKTRSDLRGMKQMDNQSTQISQFVWFACAVRISSSSSLLGALCGGSWVSPFSIRFVIFSAINQSMVVPRITCTRVACCPFPIPLLFFVFFAFWPAAGNSFDFAPSCGALCVSFERGALSEYWLFLLLIAIASSRARREASHICLTLPLGFIPSILSPLSAYLCSGGSSSSIKQHFSSHSLHHLVTSSSLTALLLCLPVCHLPHSLILSSQISVYSHTATSPRPAVLFFARLPLRTHFRLPFAFYFPRSFSLFSLIPFSVTHPRALSLSIPFLPLATKTSLPSFLLVPASFFAHFLNFYSLQHF